MSVPGSKHKVEYDYWFLTQLNSNENPAKVHKLCQQHECAKWKSNSTSSSPTTTEKTRLAKLENITSSPNITNDRIRNISHGSSSSTIGSLPKCDQGELTEILKPCAEIWQSFCKCYGCSNTCEEDGTVKVMQGNALSSSDMVTS